MYKDIKSYWDIKLCISLNLINIFPDNNLCAMVCTRKLRYFMLRRFYDITTTFRKATVWTATLLQYRVWIVNNENAYIIWISRSYSLNICNFYTVLNPSFQNKWLEFFGTGDLEKKVGFTSLTPWVAKILIKEKQFGNGRFFSGDWVFRSTVGFSFPSDLLRSIWQKGVFNIFCIFYLQAPFPFYFWQLKLLLRFRM